MTKEELREEYFRFLHNYPQTMQSLKEFPLRFKKHLAWKARKAKILKLRKES